MEISKEHEEFKQRLVDDVLGSTTDEDDRVPMEKVVLLIWLFRDDPTVVTFMARFVAKYAGSRHVFDGIEFYLPQLAHMIIHLEVEWDDAILERFALVIAQQSLHFALQFNWILSGALHDYRPERDDGTPNPSHHRVFYMRCLKLIKNVERCVVYGKPRAQELQRLYEKGKITKKEMAILEQADRRFNALQITAEPDPAALEQLDGWMTVALPHPKELTRLRSAKYYYCVLERHVLSLFKSRLCCTRPTHRDQLTLVRALNLEQCTLRRIGSTVIGVATPKYRLELGCASGEERTLWMRRLSEETTSSILFGSHAESTLKLDLTEPQLNRYEFFQNERDFVSDLTAIAEALRFQDRAERRKAAPGLMQNLKIPPNVYLPLCNSSDIWRRVADKVPEETRVFNTKERCPVVMHFVCRRGELSERGVRIHHNVDVAEYMHNHFDVVAEAENEVPELSEDLEDSSENKDTDPIKHSDHGSVRSGSAMSQVWDDDDDEPPASPKNGQAPSTPMKLSGNKRVQKLLRESVVTLPNMLSKRLKNSQQSRKRVISVMDRQTELQPMVTILDGDKQRPEVIPEDDAVSVETSSVLFRDTILLGQMDEGDIDLECIQRATAIISGGENWAMKSAKMLESARQQCEQEGEVVQLEIASCLAKSNDDLRQEVFMMQMIHFYKSVFAQAELPLWLKTYRILSTSDSTGLLELLTDATSIDGLKKAPGFPAEGGLRKYFEATYGGPKSKAFKAAQTNFMQSLAGYSLVSYLLGLKDRHNGNIMIDTRGHLIFIDFGFAMGMKPGHEFSFEQAPFKLTKEYVEVMDGVGSECYQEFERLFVAGFEAARKNSQIALGLVEIMMYKSNYPCFTGWRYGHGRALKGFEDRLMLRMSDARARVKALKLVRKSRQHCGTYLYDAFQKATNGYAI